MMRNCFKLFGLKFYFFKEKIDKEKMNENKIKMNKNLKIIYKY